MTDPRAVAYYEACRKIAALKEENRSLKQHSESLRLDLNRLHIRGLRAIEEIESWVSIVAISISGIDGLPESQPVPEGEST